MKGNLGWWIVVMAYQIMFFLKTTCMVVNDYGLMS
jgi:hypothetical protein